MSLPDTQSEKDVRGLSLGRVGISALRWPVELPAADDSTDEKAPKNSVGTWSLAVELPAAERGTHMSRFIEALQAWAQPISEAAISALAADLRSRLHAQRSFVQLSFTYFRLKKAPVSERTGYIDYEVTYRYDDAQADYPLSLQVIVPIATLCPCSKSISERGAHNQRGHVTVTVRGSTLPSIDELITLTEAGGSAELFSALKRDDEKAVTEQAYDNPAFVEDVVRNVSLALEKRGRLSYYCVEAENFESIHNHNAFARRECAF
jgi:GTP cyclohydrolase IB